ncbi:MAG: histidinol dehydrogenase [Bacteroidales bacterium]|nr:histidinol dehydrogenase [Bacteroidales bacterium]
MRIYIEPDRKLWPSLARRVNRDDAMLDWRVTEILKSVKEGGDTALNRLIGSIEGFVPANLRVSDEEIEAAAGSLTDSLKDAISTAAERIRAFHTPQVPLDTEWDDGHGVVCKRRFLPIRRVGLYVPGGTAPLFSTVLMLGVTSSVAGCPERIICTPPAKDGSVDPAILYAAKICGINEIYKIGGAQAVAAMAYGTETFRKVDKIFGPGNRYVLKAKQIVCREGVAVDMPAGPSEVMVVADDSAKVPFVVSDLLSQAEHGPDSQVTLVCRDLAMAREVQNEIKRRKETLPRKEIVQLALADSRIIVYSSLEDCMDFANYYAPEHLILSVEDPDAVALKVEAAGSVFLGNYSPESAGDYASGTNHILPTRGTAVAWSGVGVDTFMHAITYQSLSAEGLSRIGETIISMAEAEGLRAHADAVRVRLENENN